MYSLTSLHPGVGRGGEFVDLPVQRDEFGYPAVWATSIKGSLRSYLEVRGQGAAAKAKIIFGPRPGEDVDYSSSVVVHDARLLLLTARSLKGVWLHVTSSHLLSYLDSYLEALDAIGVRSEGLGRVREGLRGLREKASRASGGRALVSSERYLVRGKLVVNEGIFEASVEKDLLDLVGKLLPDGIRGRVEGVALVSDDDLQSIVGRSLVVQHRVRLDYESKTVGVGPWSEEHVPQRTIFVSLVVSLEVRRKSSEIKQPSHVWGELSKIRWLNIGGKESVGKGLVMLGWLG